MVKNILINENEIKKSNKTKIIILTAIILIIAISAGTAAIYFSKKNKVYYAEDFNIETVKSSVDFNKNGTNDYEDILKGARMAVESLPTYRGDYWDTAYPPDDIGVCTDVVWRAFKNAGYSLKDMIDMDIAENLSEYPRITGKPDPNIDFRRVPNLMSFFKRNATVLTLDTKEIEEWQPGDIVTYGTDHVAIVSDKRNGKGVPYIIHHGSDHHKREEDNLYQDNISGHYRFDASKMDYDRLIAFKEEGTK